MKKFLSLILSVIMVFTVLPFTVSAEVANTLPADMVIKSGEKYYISTVEDLKTLAKIVNEDGNTCEGASFWLNNDIVVNDGAFTLSDSGEPLYNSKPVAECKELISIDSIGTSSRNSFKGTFVGDGHTISGLYQNALFGYCSRANISGIHIKNTYVTSNSIFCNILSSCGTIRYSSVEGIVNSESTNVGIFAGRVMGTNFYGCSATGYVKGNSAVGGFVGYMSGSEIENSMSNTKIHANSTAGGFVGKIIGNNNIFKNCAAIGTLECADGTGGQFTSTIGVYYYDDGYDVERTLNVCYTAVKSAEGIGFCHTFEGDTAGVNQCYYMSNEDGENGFITYTEAEMKTAEFVDILNADIFAELEQYPGEWGDYGINFVANNGEFPIPYYLHTKENGVPGHDFSDWKMYNESTERRVCSFYGCDEKETRSHYHTWSEYLYNNDADADIDGTKTATCTKENCTATDTVPDWENIRTNAIPVSENITIEKGKLYTISSLEEWNIFTELCKQDTADVSFALVNDIKINHYDGYKMKPIETFNGTFDGLGHSITSVILETNDTDLTGIFALCDGAEIKNITINGTIVSDGGAYGEALAVLCAKAVNSKIENCTIICSASGTAKYIGGLVGYAENCEIIGCRTLSLGAVGAEKSTVGGLAGKIVSCTVKECYNNADIRSSGIVGGLIGDIEKSELRHCYNIGDVYGNGYSYSGGFAGMIEPLETDDTIYFCYSSGNVIGGRSGKFCGYYLTTNIFALGGCWFVGEDVSQADAHGLINSSYNSYRDSLYDDDGYYYPIEKGKQLSLYSFSEEVAKVHGDSYYLSDADNRNKGYSQLRRFHTEHVWGEYIADSHGNLVAECLCVDCRYTDVKEKAPSSDVTKVEYIQQEDTHKDFTVTANGRKSMIQFMEPDGGTRTYDRYHKNVKITSYNADGEVVNSMARDLAYEVWEIYSNMSVGVEIKVRGKVNGKWDAEKYSFTIEPYNPIISMELSSTSGKLGPVPATVIADDKTEKVMFKMPDNSTVTVASKATDENGNKIFTGKAWMNKEGLNEIKILIYRNSVWRQVGTLEYTVV